MGVSKLKIIAASLIFMCGLAAPVTSVGAVDVISDSCSTGGATLCEAKKENIEKNGFFTNVVNVLFFAVGVIATIAIIIGGIKYVTANGDASSIKSAKDTIMYAVIGLAAAIMAGAIVNFVISRF